MRRLLKIAVFIGLMVLAFIYVSGRLAAFWAQLLSIFTINPAGNTLNGAPPVPGAKPRILTYPQNRPLTDEEVFQLANHMTHHFGGRVNQFDLMASAWVESSFRPWVERYEAHLGDYSVGLMQVLTTTALDLFDKGYTAFGRPTRSSLKNPAVSMYYGAAYFDWLRKAYPGRNLEWYVRAYNGGPGHNYSAATTAYWAKWREAAAVYGGGSGTTIRVGV